MFFNRKKKQQSESFQLGKGTLNSFITGGCFRGDEEQKEKIETSSNYIVRKNWLDTPCENGQSLFGFY